jgi:hypothetical protein
MVSIHRRQQHFTGCSAAWLARLTGGQKVGGSNPLSPIAIATWSPGRLQFSDAPQKESQRLRMPPWLDLSWLVQRSGSRPTYEITLDDAAGHSLGQEGFRLLMINR